MTFEYNSEGEIANLLPIGTRVRITYARDLDLTDHSNVIGEITEHDVYDSMLPYFVRLESDNSRYIWANAELVSGVNATIPVSLFTQLTADRLIKVVNALEDVGVKVDFSK